MQLDFALGKAYADLKEHGRAFDYWRRGNERKRARIEYDEAATAGTFERKMPSNFFFVGRIHLALIARAFACRTRFRRSGYRRQTSRLTVALP